MRTLKRPRLLASAAILVAIGCGVFIYHHESLPATNSPEGLLAKADELAWNNNWIAAEPMFKQAQVLFIQNHKYDEALYAEVSQIPPHMGDSSLPEQIWRLTQDLTRPELKSPETRLRILVIRGMLEVNYDAAMARSTWSMVEALAKDQHHYLLASRASGEQGIAAFILGDMAMAKKQVLKAWAVAKVADPAARVRFASVYGAGLVELQKYKEALGPLDDAIKLAEKKGLAYPSIAINSKIEALSGLGRNEEALTLSQEAMKRATKYQLQGHLYEFHQTRGGVYERMNSWHDAISDYMQAIIIAKNMSHWRGLAASYGLLARAYEHEELLLPALAAIDEAIEANKHIPDELYYVPRNLAIKAEIEAKLGHTRTSNDLYQKSSDVIDSLLTMIPTENVERLLIGQLSSVYARYSSSLCGQEHFQDAFRIIEKARGRIETQALQHYSAAKPHETTPAERELTRLNIKLINTDDPEARAQLLRNIYDVEQTDPISLADQAASNPVKLKDLQEDLDPTELLIEYVLDEPHSYVLAITRESVKRYTLGNKADLEAHGKQYRSTIMGRKSDLRLAQLVFDELLAKIPEYPTHPNLIIVPDGLLNLLPFSALADGGQYIVSTHTVSVVPSGTVLHILRTRRQQEIASSTLPYLGVAAWTSTSSAKNLFLRAIGGPERSEFIPLPASKREVELIANDLPKPNIILLGNNATEGNFKNLPLSKFNVLHLALHGYADLEYPDRSALVFAPQENSAEDGLLQVREIRQLHLNASLVTLSACNTGLGPVSAAGIANLPSAFIEAGAQSIVSTLWELEDQSTSHFMTLLYGNLGRNRQKADALREAQLGALNSGLSPYFWAGFQLVGEPRGTLLREPVGSLAKRSLP